MKDERNNAEAPGAVRVRAAMFNLPNQLTFLRLMLSVVLFCFIACEYYLTSLVLFIIAAGTDWLDGYYARKYNEVTTLGRILDPFADKVIVCGTFIFLVAVPVMAEVPWGLRAWMVVVLVGRELLVTALRSFIEDRGSDFSAKMSGKLKMVVQCFAAGACLFYLSYPAPQTENAAPWCWWVTVISIWSAVALTVYSGVVYIRTAVRLLRE
jgi:CDP-diacylglycerol---glycerol-3-phosphate 3-phosphatidyltransferase